MKLNRKILNLGCGLDYRDNAINVDYDPNKHPDIIADLTAKEWLWEENESVDVILANHILEHIPNPVNFMDRCWDLLKYDGRLSIKVPHYKHVTAYSDPTHCNFFTERSFKLFTHSDKTNSFTQKTWAILNQNIYYQAGGFPFWHLANYFGIRIGATPSSIHCQLTPNKKV